MKKIMIACSILAAILAGMFFEYRYIMVNLNPFVSDDGNIYIEIFDQVDVYDMIE